MVKRFEINIKRINEKLTQSLKANQIPLYAAAALSTTKTLYREDCTDSDLKTLSNYKKVPTKIKSLS